MTVITCLTATTYNTVYKCYMCTVEVIGKYLTDNVQKRVYSYLIDLWLIVLLHYVTYYKGH